MGVATVAHLSDVHIGLGDDHDLFGRDPLASLEAVLAAVRAASPDALFLTGDLTDAGDLESTRYVAEHVTGVAPVVRWLAGNHDEPSSLQAVHADWLEPAVVGAWTLIPVVTYVPQMWHGHVSDNEEARIRGVLAALTTPYALLAIHQPAMGICDAPGCRLSNPDTLFGLVHDFPAVHGVLSGHQHQPFVHDREGVSYIGGGSTCTQVEHIGEGFAARDNGPMYGLVRLGDDGSISVEQYELAPLPLADHMTEPTAL